MGLLPSHKYNFLYTMVQMTGTYTQVSSENYEEFMKALNVGYLLRKAALASTPVMTITEDNGVWNIVTKTSMKSMELTFKLGEEFVTAVREFTDDGLTYSTSVDDVTATQVYKR